MIAAAAVGLLNFGALAIEREFECLEAYIFLAQLEETHFYELWSQIFVLLERCHIYSSLSINWIYYAPVHSSGMSGGLV